MEDYQNPLNWGLNWEQTKELFKKKPLLNLTASIKGTPSRLSIGDLSLYNFQGDCGALYLQGANYATDENLQEVEEWCSLSGFSKLFATIVTTKSSAETKRNLFVKEGWTVIDEGKSNRNPSKTDITLFKRIDCKYKGY